MSAACPGARRKSFSGPWQFRNRGARCRSEAGFKRPAASAHARNALRCALNANPVRREATPEAGHPQANDNCEPARPAMEAGFAVKSRGPRLRAAGSCDHPVLGMESAPPSAIVAGGVVRRWRMAPFNAWPLLFLTFPGRGLADRRRWPPDAGAACRRRRWAGWWFGLGYFVPGLYWIGYAFLVDAPHIRVADAVRRARPAGLIWRCSPRSASRWRA